MYLAGIYEGPKERKQITSGGVIIARETICDVAVNLYEDYRHIGDSLPLKTFGTICFVIPTEISEADVPTFLEERLNLMIQNGIGVQQTFRHKVIPREDITIVLEKVDKS